MAVQIFQYCGVDISDTVQVDTLMDKFAPFLKTNKSEYRYLRSLLDPEQINLEITVSKLALALNQYHENQKSTIDLNESFNPNGEQTPQDSDSGISTDSFQMLEELQCELREKAHLAQQLRIQLDIVDQHHEEALGTLTAERDTLKAKLNVMREENASLSHARLDYEEACEWLGSSERALQREVQFDLVDSRREALRLTNQVLSLEMEKLTLQDLLTKSKDECHRINEMYASRQSLLLEENETLKTDYADLSAKLQDQEELTQQLIKEKALLEIELKDILNKSEHVTARVDDSIDVSYTDEQMLTALVGNNGDGKFVQDQSSIETQVRFPCKMCVKQTAPLWSIGRFFWDSVKGLFQLFAVVCFLCAVCVLYGIQRAPASCREISARWLRPSDLLDLLLRVEYVAEVPM